MHIVNLMIMELLASWGLVHFAMKRRSRPTHPSVFAQVGQVIYAVVANVVTKHVFGYDDNGIKSTVRDTLTVSYRLKLADEAGNLIQGTNGEDTVFTAQQSAFNDRPLDGNGDPILPAARKRPNQEPAGDEFQAILDTLMHTTGLPEEEACDLSILEEKKAFASLVGKPVEVTVINIDVETFDSEGNPMTVHDYEVRPHILADAASPASSSDELEKETSEVSL